MDTLKIIPPTPAGQADFLDRLTLPTTAAQSRTVLEHTRRLMQERRRPGEQLLADLRAFKAARRAARQGRKAA